MLALSGSKCPWRGSLGRKFSAWSFCRAEPCFVFTSLARRGVYNLQSLVEDRLHAPEEMQ